jgi:hypothetical protein
MAKESDEPIGVVKAAASVYKHSPKKGVTGSRKINGLLPTHYPPQELKGSGMHFKKSGTCDTTEIMKQSRYK